MAVIAMAVPKMERKKLAFLQACSPPHCRQWLGGRQIYGRGQESGLLQQKCPATLEERVISFPFKTIISQCCCSHSWSACVDKRVNSNPLPSICSQEPMRREQRLPNPMPHVSVDCAHHLPTWSSALSPSLLVELVSAA